MTAEKTGYAGLGDLGRLIHLRVAALILDNFKSFKKKTRIPLEDGFSTISGPNGSGKSNIIDAMQFVMGLAHAKGMRAERLTDLICSDGGKNSARVSLELQGTFQRTNAQGHDDLVQRTLTVTRVVRRLKSGTQAHYELDDEPIRLSDLHDLLRELGFPTSGQNIVMQGDVIRVTSMGPTARRGILDELAGAKEFDKRITLAHQELEAADRCTEDTKLIHKELSQRLKQLEKERDQALRFQTLSSRKQCLGEDLIVLDVTEAELKAGDKAAELAGARTRLKTLAKEQDQGAREAKAKHEALAEVEQELSTKGEGERLDVVKQVESLKTRLGEARSKVQELQTEQTQAREQSPKLAGEVTSLREQVEARAAQLEGLDAQLSEQEARHEALAGRTQAISETLRQNSAAQIEAAQQGQLLRQEAERKRTRERELLARDRSLAEELSSARAELTHLREAVSVGQARQAELSESSRLASERYRAARQEAAQAQEQQRALHKQVSDLRSGLESQAAKVGRAQREVAAAEARRQQANLLSGGQALKYLRDQRLGGLHGPVSDLVDFESRYAQALEAAAGGRLRWVVVDDERVAKRAIEMLKQSRAGRLSFAPLTKIQGQRLDGQPPRGRSIVGYALDLVSAERRYDKVLEAVFGNTLVVERLEDGLPLIGRYRMVTLDGDILERHGLMTGGAQTKGGRLLLATAKANEEIEAAQEVVRELEQQAQAARGRLRQAEKALQQAADKASKLNAALAEQEAHTASVNAELSRLETQLTPQGERLGVLEGELGQLEEAQADVSQELTRLREALQHEHQDMSALDAQQGDATAFETLTQQAKALEAELRQVEQGLAELRQQRADVAGERRALEERLVSARQRAEEAQAGLEALEAKLQEAQAAVTALETEQRESERVLAELSSELKALSARRDAAREAADKAKDALREVELAAASLSERIQVLDQERQELEATAASMRAEAEAQEIEVPSVEEAPPDLAESRRKIAEVLTKVSAELDSMGPVNQLAIDQYEDAAERHQELDGKLEHLETEKNEIRTRIVDLEGKKKRAFLEAFERVSEAFQHTFYELARGEGRLRLEDKKDPFGGGLIIEARPRGKKLSRLEVMSGGEKTLTALAFIFALQEVNPAPFFVFDEVDAALDGVNTDILSQAIARRGDERQYLVISHHRVMLEKSHQTIGVSMRKGWGTVVTGVSMADPEIPESATAGAEVA